MAQGPIFGIKSSPIINTQVIQIIASAARQMSASMRARRQLDLDKQKLQAGQQQSESNLKLREENLKLQQDRLAFDKDRESKIEEDRKSKQKGREGRSASRLKADEDRAVRTRISFFRALSTEKQRTVTAALDRVNKQVAQLPLVTDPDTQQELIEFEGQTSQQIARTVSVRERSAASMSEFDREFEPDKALVLDRQLRASQEALGIRQKQTSGFIQSQGHEIANDASILNNLMNGFQNQISTALGTDLSDIKPPETPSKNAINEASAKDPTATQAPEKKPAGAPDIQVGNPQLQATVADQFVEIATSKEPNNNQLNTLRLEARKLTPDEQITVFRQVQAAVGTERANVIVFGRANP